MTDRELLELAAKACEYKYKNNALWDGRDVVAYSWNPLTDDGDALRLAVKLEMMIDYIDRGYMAGHILATAGPVMLSIYEPREPDPYAATRRAITRAAAEIGKAKCE